VRRVRVAAIVLAAGTSSRMRDVHKLLVHLDGIPLLRRTVLETVASRACDVLVVTGHRERDVRASLGELPVTCVPNANYAAGLSTSLRAGVTALDEDVDGVLVCLGDMPYVRAGDLDALIVAFESSDGDAVVVPMHGERRGNPVLWPRSLFPALLALTGDEGARSLLAAHPARILPVVVDAPGVLVDIDTPEDIV
jgi:molybdenum cofactor cytidylyltransferase